MKRLILLLLLILQINCSSDTKHPQELIGCWARSDDASEYQGTYLYTLHSNGKLELINYSPESTILYKKYGYWELKDNILIWQVKYSNRIIDFQYKQYTNDIYYDLSEGYYVPVYLIQVKKKMTNGLAYFDFSDTKGFMDIHVENKKEFYNNLRKIR